MCAWLTSVCHIGHHVIMTNVCVAWWSLGKDHLHEHDVSMTNVCVTCWSLGKDRLHGHDVCMANVCVTLGMMCAVHLMSVCHIGHDVCMTVSHVGLWAGIAYMGTMCAGSSVSVVESKPNQNAVLTAVHELGHRSVRPFRCCKPQRCYLPL